MKKAYILVHREPYEGDTIYGIYSTERKAERAYRDALKDDLADNFLILTVAQDEEPNWHCTEVLDND